MGTGKGAKGIEHEVEEGSSALPAIAMGTSPAAPPKKKPFQLFAPIAETVSAARASATTTTRGAEEVLLERDLEDAKAVAAKAAAVLEQGRRAVGCGDGGGGSGQSDGNTGDGGEPSATAAKDRVEEELELELEEPKKSAAKEQRGGGGGGGAAKPMFSMFPSLTPPGSGRPASPSLPLTTADGRSDHTMPAAFPPSPPAQPQTVEETPEQLLRKERESRKTLLLLKPLVLPPKERPKPLVLLAGSGSGDGEGGGGGRGGGHVDPRAVLKASKAAAVTAAKKAQEDAAARRNTLRRLSTLGSGLFSNGAVRKGPSLITDDWSLTTKVPVEAWRGVEGTDEKTGCFVESLVLRSCGLCGFLGAPDSFVPFFERSSPHLLRLDFSNNPHVVGELKEFARLNCLQHLKLDSCGGISGELGSLMAMKHLSSLSLAKCVSVSGDVGSLADSKSLTTLDVSRCPIITELPQSWLLRFLKPKVGKNKRVKKGWSPWGSADWRTCYARLRARPEAGAYWLGQSRPDLLAEWEQEEKRHEEWPEVDFVRSKGLVDPNVGFAFEAPQDVAPTVTVGTNGGSFADGEAPGAWGGEHQGGGGGEEGGGGGGGSESSRSNRTGSTVTFDRMAKKEGQDDDRAPSRARSSRGSSRGSSRPSTDNSDYEMHTDDEDDEDDSDGSDRPTTREARDEQKRRRQERMGTPTGNAPNAGPGAPVASLGWIVNLRLPACGLEVDLADLSPVLVGPFLVCLDLSKNKGVVGDLQVFRTSYCDALRELYLHNTNVSGDFKSIGPRHCPDLKICFLQGTAVTGGLENLPGEVSRPKSRANGLANTPVG